VQQPGNRLLLVAAELEHDRRDGEQVRDVGDVRALARLIVVDLDGERHGIDEAVGELHEDSSPWSRQWQSDAMQSTHLVAIDRAGRLVVPKALRDELGLEPGQPLRASVRDGRLEIEPEPIDAELVERDGVLVITPNEPVPVLSTDEVRLIVESTRR
jgi:AbrB family looped-hinge helix DNA binding protein